MFDFSLFLFPLSSEILLSVNLLLSLYLTAPSSLSTSSAIFVKLASEIGSQVRRLNRFASNNILTQPAMRLASDPDLIPNGYKIARFASFFFSI